MSDEPLFHLYSRSAQTQQASSIREICKLITRPEVQSLAGGWPGPDTFPVEELTGIARDVLAERGAEALQYGTTEGLPELRQEVAAWASSHEGIQAELDNIVITHGSQQGMDLAFRVLVDPGDTVLVGLPTYFGASGALAALGARVVGIPVDEDGMDTKAAAQKLDELGQEGATVKAVYVIPNFQNPRGVCLSRPRREHLLALAQEHDLVLVEDDPYGDLRFEGEKIPSLKALEKDCGATGRVVHAHSFSKTFAPGLRLAWVAAEAGLVRQLVVAKQYVDACTNSFGQYLLLEFMRRGLLARQIRSNTKYYRKKRDCLLAAMDRHFPRSVRWNRPAGGLFVFVQLPPELPAQALMQEALEHNVAFVCGSQFFVDGSGEHTFRLSYAQSSPAVIEAAVAKIGRLLSRQLST